MKTKKILLCRTFKILLWLSGFLFLFLTATKILQPKYFFNSVSSSPETELWKSFYDEPENSVDVIFLGSSHIYNSINPLEFYKQTGLTGFNLASSSQDVPTSYFYLKEALRYQKPDYVVMDTYGILYTAFSEEVCYKRSLDDMKWSSVKAEAINTWLKHLEHESFRARVLTITDYHSRWEDLGKEDFNPDEFITSVNGFCPCFSSASDVKHDSFSKYTNLPNLEEGTLTYFEQLLQLCSDNGIKLICIAAPDTTWTKGYSCAIQDLMSSHSLPFIDYNTEEIFPKIGINDETDWRNQNHLNAYGADIFTRYLAQDLIADKLISPKKDTNKHDALWQKKIAAYAEQSRLGSLSATTDFKTYLQKINSPDYSIFIAASDEASHFLKGEPVTLMKNLGLTVSIADNDRNSYYAVITPEKTCEKTGIEKLTLQDSFNNGTSSYYISSAGYDSGRSCSIIIDNTEYAQNRRGLNFVIYDNHLKKVVDSVRFDTHTPKLTASR